METSPFGCFRCNGTDHWADACPELQPVTSKSDQLARITRYVAWCFEDHRITVPQKAKLIELANSLYDQWRKATERKSA